MRRGILQTVGAYLLWGVSPVFWKGLAGVPAIDVLGHRAMWTFVVLCAVHLVRRSWSAVSAAARNPRVLRIELAAALLIGTNWLVWVWAMNADRVVEGSLGYFMNPLVSVSLGVVFLRESLRRAQWVAVGLAATGVAWLTASLGSLPWVSLVLAFTFGVYGLCKKVVDRPPLDGLAVEMFMLVLPALIFLTVRTASGHGVLGSAGPGEVMLLIGSGAFTALPLLLFAGAARKVPLSVMGIVQYISPTLNFLLGVLVYEELFDLRRLIGYVVIWMGLLVFATDGICATRRGATRRPVDPSTELLKRPDLPGPP